MKKNIIWLIAISLAYIPILIFSLFIMAISGIDDSCKFLDLTGVSAISHTPCINRVGNLIFDILIIATNLFVFFLMFIFINKIIKKFKKIKLK